MENFLDWTKLFGHAVVKEPWLICRDTDPYQNQSRKRGLNSNRAPYDPAKDRNNVAYHKQAQIERSAQQGYMPNSQNDANVNKQPNRIQLVKPDL